MTNTANTSKATRTQDGSIVVVSHGARPARFEVYQMERGLEMFLGYHTPGERRADAMVRRAVSAHETVLAAARRARLAAA